MLQQEQPQPQQQPDLFEHSDPVTPGACLQSPPSPITTPSPTTAVNPTISASTLSPPAPHHHLFRSRRKREKEDEEEEDIRST
ncbi:hypothetical protein DM860_015349 [Cuscuta australis]|uniref:Uncharacterized protein n=1 Tax=Cuscuta australis TaxID=267555 RepID=A0A328DLK0_9ASTE|nr:hypothetical protein DM860_015349 [Cuscuta australis]